MNDEQGIQNTDAQLITLFDRIVSKQIPASVVYEDELCMAFKDINPQAPIHFILIPKNRDGLSQLSKAEDRHKKLLGHLMIVVGKITSQEPLLSRGFRIVINDGISACQTIYHLHIHILGGTQLTWPPGTTGPSKRSPSL